MSLFIDTSALLAVLNADDLYHQQARLQWVSSISEDEVLVSTNYVLIETNAILQNRIGMEAVRLLWDDIVPVLTVHWVDETLHNASLSALVTASRRKLSLVDCVSFECMRRLGIKKAFTFDPHFKDQGFTNIPV